MAVIAHEVHELGFLRQDLQGDGIIIDHLILHTEPGEGVETCIARRMTAADRILSMGWEEVWQHDNVARF